MSAASPYIVEDEDDEAYNSADSDLELLDYDSDSSEPEIVAVRDRTPPSASSNSSSDSSKQHRGKAAKNGPISLPDTEIRKYKLSKNTVIEPGDTVELQDHSTQETDAMHSGDFLYIKHIIMDMSTDEVRLRGHRMRRTKYLGQIFDWKMNELGMVLRVDENDDRCPFVAGMEDVAVKEAIGVRECALTNKPYPLMSFRMDGRCAYPASMSNEEVKRQMFQGGRLTCRVVSILFIRSTTGKPYSGIVRHLYAHESDTPITPTRTKEAGLSRETSISVEDNEEDDLVIITNSFSSRGKRRARSDSIEFLGAEPPKRKTPLPSKKGRYIFGDVFCGAGGASQGAVQAGLYVGWGLDMDKHALQAYRLNHPSAIPFQRNAHDFPPTGVSKEDLRVDVLHLSPPCCYWSPAHTREGPNDQANYEAIYTVGPILTKVKPRVATLEQTFGLVTNGQHKRNFLMLLYDIGKAGYDVRYKIQDLSEYGLVQQRKRLLIIAARRGTPLPPFPKPTHGRTGSGLKPFVYVDQALQPIERLGSRATNDPYHQPKPFPSRKTPYDPHDFLKGCITTTGSESYHYSGKRRWTARELSLFQSFPYKYQFTGGQGEATKQIGNAFPPVMAEAMYRTIAKTLEAFDNSLIGAEDDLSDLDGLLERKGARIPLAPQTPRSLFDSPPRTMNLPYRYLSRDNPRPSQTSPSTNTSPFARKKEVKPQASGVRNGDSFSPMSLLGGLLGGFSQAANPRVPPVSPNKRDRQFGVLEDDDEIIYLSD